MLARCQAPQAERRREILRTLLAGPARRVRAIFVVGTRHPPQSSEIGDAPVDLETRESRAPVCARALHGVPEIGPADRRVTEGQAASLQSDLPELGTPRIDAIHQIAR